MLCAVTERVRTLVRSTDTVARLGGDEFAILQIGASQPAGATILAIRVIEAIAEHFDIEGHQVVIGTSVGIAVAPTDGTEPDQLLKNADMALYRAKATGQPAHSPSSMFEDVFKDMPWHLRQQRQQLGV